VFIPSGVNDLYMCVMTNLKNAENTVANILTPG
jgi:hypothetical protein